MGGREIVETLPDDWRKALAGRLEGVDLDALDRYAA